MERLVEQALLERTVGPDDPAQSEVQPRRHPAIVIAVEDHSLRRCGIPRHRLRRGHRLLQLARHGANRHRPLRQLLSRLLATEPQARPEQQCGRKLGGTHYIVVVLQDLLRTRAKELGQRLPGVLDALALLDEVRRAGG